MWIAIDENNNRILPTISGQEAICPICKNVVIAKCGELNVWHWAHKLYTGCDPWHEHETYWHRLWKSHFPIEWQEVILEKNGEKHIADVKIPNGMIIEFQNSPISSKTIRIREDFYENMVWVVNANEFKDNFELRSVVSRSLKVIDMEYTHKIRSYENPLDSQMKEMDNQMLEYASKRKQINDDKRWKERELQVLLKTNDNFDEFADSFITHLQSPGVYLDHETSSITSEIISNYKHLVNAIIKSINGLNEKIASIKKELQRCDQLEDIEIENKKFKIVEYSSINPKIYPQVRAVLKSSRHTLFPEIISFRSESEFLRYDLKQSNYIFAVDPTDSISKLKNYLDECLSEIATQNESLSALFNQIKKDLYHNLQLEIQRLQKEIHKLEPEERQIDTMIEQLTESIKRIDFERDLAMKNFKEKIIREKAAKRSMAMVENKGIYTFNWKHERKSWHYAYATIYFDVGEDFLFENIFGQHLKKKMIKDFLDEMRSS